MSDKPQLRVPSDESVPSRESAGTLVVDDPPPDISPRIDDDSVGYCREECPSLGEEVGIIIRDCAQQPHATRPDDVCVPHVIRLAAENKRLKEELAEAIEHINW